MSLSTWACNSCFVGRRPPEAEFSGEYVFKDLVFGKVPDALHAAEIPYTFDTISFGLKDNASAVYLEMAQTISGYWADFVKTGDPNGASTPNRNSRGAGLQATRNAEVSSAGSTTCWSAPALFEQARSSSSQKRELRANEGSASPC
jgi:hypothetical protein